MGYSLKLDPSVEATLVVKLFDNVKNMGTLKQKVLSGSLECCLIKPHLIVDPFQIAIAANKALVAEKLTTRTVYSEILFNLSISKNITQSLQTFGIDDKMTQVLTAVIVKDKEQSSEELIYKEIDGNELDLSKLKDFNNVAAIQKCYKLSKLETENSLLESIVSKIATKEFIV